MENALLIGLSRQVALSRELDVVANNIANLNTTGFKADNSLFEEYLSSPARAAETGSRVSFVWDRGIWHDMSPGALERTGSPLDVAIDGKGYLVVQTARGPRYTRAGSLQVNSAGQLVTPNGDPVLGDNGPITFQRNDNHVSIGRDGTVTVREGTSNVDQLRGRLRLVEFADARQLQKDGDNQFAPIGNAQPQPAAASSLIQGSLERSNVRGVVEMTRMVEITRSYQQIAGILQQQGDISQQAIDKLAEVPN